MAVGITQEQKDKIVSEAQKYGGVDSEAFKNKVNTQYGTGAYDTLVNKAAEGVTTGQITGDLTKANQELGTNISQEQVNLGKQISTGTFSAEQAKRYNDLTGSQTGARDLALGTQQGANNIKTTINQEEANTMSSEGVTPGQNITIPETVKAPEVKPTTTTETKTSEVKPQKIETIEQFKQKGANLPNLEQFIEDRYGTTAQQEPDGVTAVINGEKFKWTIDANGNPIKVSLGQAQQPVASNPDDLFNGLVGGGSVNQSDPNYKIAKTRFDNYSKYKDYTDALFQSAFNEGLIVPGTQLYNDLQKDPKVKLQMDKAIALNRINGEKIDGEKIAETQSDEIANNTKTTSPTGETITLKQALEDGYITQDEINSMTNNKEVTSKAKEVEDLKNKVDELQNVYDNIETEIEKQLEGTGASTLDRAVMVANAQKKLLGPLNLAIDKYNNANGSLVQMKNDASNLLAMNLSEYHTQLARQQALSDKAEERTYNETQAQKELEQKYNYTYGDINSTNPQVQNIAIENAVKSMYEKYPLPGMESQSIKVQKIKDKIAQGMTGTQAIQEVENEIRNSNRYKQYLASEQVKIQPKATESWTKLNDGTLYNQATGETKSITPTTDTTQTGTGYDFIKKQEGFRDKAYWDVNGWAVGYGQHSINGVPVKEGDTIDKTTADADFQNRVNNAKFQGLVKTNLTENQEAALYDLEHNVGSGVWNFPNGKAIIDAVNNNDFEKASNIMATSGIGTTNASTKEVMPGLVKRRKEASKLLLDTGTAGTKQYTDAQLGLLSTIDNLTPTNSKALKDAGLTSEDYGLFKNGGLKPTSSQVAGAKSMVDKIDTLLKHSNLSDAVGAFDVRTPTIFGETNDFINKYNAFVANLAKDNLGVLKGPMSDKDVQFIKEMSTELNLNTDEQAFKDNLEKLKSQYEKIANGQSLNDAKSGTNTPTNNTGTSTATGTSTKPKNDPLGLFD